MIKKLKNWGTICLLIGMACLAIFAYRHQMYDAKFDTKNIISLILTINFFIAGAILRMIEAIKRKNEVIREGK